jgi:hypothetical protein
MSPEPMNKEELIRQVKTNCDTADAQSWGYYSICGLLMRLRELYRSEHSLMPWDKIPKEPMAEWIVSKEMAWERLAGKCMRPLNIDGNQYDPFQVDEVNMVLNRHGLIYGVGYGLFSKPTFFLALLERKREFQDYRIFYSGKELCRDLSAPTAMLQGRCIFVRLERLTSLLWEKFEELKGRKFGGLLKDAFSLYGIEGTENPSEELHRKIAAVSSDVTEVIVLHEIGEAFEDEQSDEWLSIISRDEDKWTELYLRGIKDILADTSDMGPLKFIVDHEQRSLLNFYIVLMDGVRRELFPEMLNAFQQFSEHGDWSAIEEARIRGYQKAYKLRSDILSLLDKNSAVLKKHLEAVKQGGW